METTTHSLSQEERIRIEMRRRKITLWDLSSVLKLCPSAIHNRIRGFLPFSDDEKRRLEKLLEIEL